MEEVKNYSIELLSECFGTSILILIGESGIANYKFTRKPSHSTFPIAIAFGVGVYSAMMISGPITDAHLNPAMTISLMTIGKIKPFQCIFYVLGQILGAFIGASLVYLIYYSQFNKFDGGIREITGPNGTGDIFFTMPGEDIPQWNTFIDQILSTAFLMIFVMAVTNESNKMISESAKPFAFSVMIMGIISAFSINAGGAINPARDFGPRLFGAFIYGWNNVFNVHKNFFWVPIIGPIIGSIIGVWIYQAYYSIINKHKKISNNKNEKNENINEENDKTNDEIQLRKKLTKMDI